VTQEGVLGRVTADAMETREWEPIVQAYLALEYVDQWLGPDYGDYAADDDPEAKQRRLVRQPLARLQEYMLMEYSGAFEYYLPEASYALRLRSARYMTLFFLFSLFYRPFYTDLAWALVPHERPFEQPADEFERDWAAAIRAALSGWVPKLQVELMVHCRHLREKRALRRPGEMFDRPQDLKLIERPEQIYPGELRTDWGSGTDELEIRADCHAH